MREVRCGGVSRWNVALAVALALLVSAALGPPAWAVMKYGPLQLSGNMETLNLVRHPDPEEFGLVMNRNVLRARVDWDWLQNGRLIDRFDLPFIERSKLFLLYRGVYDGFYDIAPGGNQKGQTRYDDLVGGPINGNTPGMCRGGACAVDNKDASKLLPGAYSRLTYDDRTADKLQNSLREFYVDFKIKNAPLSFRIGRQQVIWGESDQFRVMDIINPLDLTWHFQMESWDEIRKPLWLAKGLWDIGELGPLSNAFLEAVYNPFDFVPSNAVDFLPRPWAAPFPDPLRPGQVDNSQGPRKGGTLISPTFHLQGTSMRKGDFQRNPQDASEFGMRFHAVTPQGFEFALNYLYGRGRAPGGTNATALKITDMYFSPDGNPNNLGTAASVPTVGYFQPDPSSTFAAPVKPIHVVGKLMYPYQHIFGLTGNYFEGDLTQAVLRFETLYALGEPFQTTDPGTLVPIRSKGLTDEQSRATWGSSPLGFTKRDVWTGMVGFDRPTWIRFLNPKATWFLTGQFFWTYIPGEVDSLCGNQPAGDRPYFGKVGTWVGGPYAGLHERQQDATKGNSGNGDNWHRWEHLITFAGTSFYRSGTVVPFIANAWDPVNDSNLTLWNIDYFYSNNFIISVQQKFWTTYGSKAPSNDNEYTAGRFDRRDETGVRLTYQF
jgi:hypothetical protein